MAQVWRNRHILTVANTHLRGDSKVHRAGRTMISTITDRDSWREGLVLVTRCPMAAKGELMFSKGPSRVCLPVASVTFPATSSFSFARAASVMWVPEGSGFESVQGR